jgi:hypothetical protein
MARKKNLPADTVLEFRTIEGTPTVLINAKLNSAAQVSLLIDQLGKMLELLMAGNWTSAIRSRPIGKVRANGSSRAQESHPDAS